MPRCGGRKVPPFSLSPELVMTRRAFIVLVLTAVLAAAAFPARAGEAKKELNPLDVFTAEAVKERVAFLASQELEGRCTGDPGCRKAAEYIREGFKKAGLKPAFGDDYFQKFEVSLSTRPGPDNEFWITARTKTYKLKVESDFAPFGFSAEAESEGEVVFAGYGISAPDSGYDDYAGIDVKDRIVLVLRRGPGSSGKEGPFAEDRGRSHQGFAAKAALARKMGAKAMLLFTGPADDPDARDILDGAYAEGRDAGIPCLHVKRRVAAAMLALCRLSPADAQKKIDGGLKPNSFVIPDLKVRIKTVASRISKESENVAGLIEGCDEALKSEVVIIGAHYDHVGKGHFGTFNPSNRGKIHPGADDNASGTAGVMLLADAFASLPYKPRRSMLFIAFSGEEMGLYGSLHYVRNPVFPLQKTAAMINLDMLGYLRDCKIYVMCAGSSPGFRGMIGEMNAGLDLKPSVLDGGGGSDQDSFYAANVPVLFFCTGMNPNYHTPKDTAENMNPAGEAEILKLVYLTAAKISSSDERPVFTSGKKSGGIPGREESRAAIGIIPDPAYKGRGVRVLQVLDDRPAQKAGIVAGDVILKLGDLDIRNLRGLVDALSKIGQDDRESKLKILVKRKNAEMEFVVVIN